LSALATGIFKLGFKTQITYTSVTSGKKEGEKQKSRGSDSKKERKKGGDPWW
jgi:hypothetical protein